jgi:hypothetical protein
MVLFDVYIEKTTSREVLATLRATIDMRLKVMNLVILVGCEGNCLTVRR